MLEFDFLQLRRQLVDSQHSREGFLDSSDHRLASCGRSCEDDLWIQMEMPVEME